MVYRLEFPEWFDPGGVLRSNTHKHAYLAYFVMLATVRDDTLKTALILSGTRLYTVSGERKDLIQLPEYEPITSMEFRTKDRTIWRNILLHLNKILYGKEPYYLRKLVISILPIYYYRRLDLVINGRTWAEFLYTDRWDPT